MALTKLIFIRYKDKNFVFIPVGRKNQSSTSISDFDQGIPEISPSNRVHSSSWLI